MLQQEQYDRIARLLNKKFYSMTYEHKLKALNMIMTEQECDQLLLQFVSNYYNAVKTQRGGNRLKTPVSLISPSLETPLYPTPIRPQKQNTAIHREPVREMNVKARMPVKDYDSHSEAEAESEAEASEAESEVESEADASVAESEVESDASEAESEASEAEESEADASEAEESEADASEAEESEEEEDYDY